VSNFNGLLLNHIASNGLLLNHIVSYFNIRRFIFVIEDMFYILNFTIVPSLFNLLSIIFITYLFNTGCFLHGELFVLSETVNILICNILLVYLAIIFCIYITNIFICTSKRGFKSKYPILYNVIILFFTIILFVLFFIFAFKGYKLYSYILNKVVTYISNIVNNIIKSIFKTNGVNPQGWGYQPPYGNQPSGGGGPSGGGFPGGGGPSGGGFPGGGPPGGGPSGGPSWGWGADNQNNRRRPLASRPLTSCGEDSCYTGREGSDKLMKCIHDFNEKAFKRYEILNNKDTREEFSSKRGWTWGSLVHRRLNNRGMDFSKHESESFARMINYKHNNVEHLIIKSWKFYTAEDKRPFADVIELHDKLSRNASPDAMLFLNKDNIYDVLDNKTLYEIMIMSNIFFIKK